MKRRICICAIAAAIATMVGACVRSGTEADSPAVSSQPAAGPGIGEAVEYPGEVSSSETQAAPSPKAVQHYEAGLAARKAGQDAEAVSELQAALALAPQYSEAHWVLGWAHAEGGRKEWASRHFAEVIRLDADGERAAEARSAIERMEAKVVEAPPLILPTGVPAGAPAWLHDVATDLKLLVDIGVDSAYQGTGLLPAGILVSVEGALISSRPETYAVAAGGGLVVIKGTLAGIEEPANFPFEVDLTEEGDLAHWTAMSAVDHYSLQGDASADAIAWYRAEPLVVVSSELRIATGQDARRLVAVAYDFEQVDEEKVTGWAQGYGGSSSSTVTMKWRYRPRKAVLWPNEKQFLSSIMEARGSDSGFGLAAKHLSSLTQ